MSACFSKFEKPQKVQEEFDILENMLETSAPKHLISCLFNADKNQCGRRENTFTFKISFSYMLK